MHPCFYGRWVTTDVFGYPWVSYPHCAMTSAPLYADLIDLSILLNKLPQKSATPVFISLMWPEQVHVETLSSQKPQVRRHLRLPKCIWAVEGKVKGGRGEVLQRKGTRYDAVITICRQRRNMRRCLASVLTSVHITASTPPVLVQESRAA
jgi:hypothetical protein